MTIKLEAKRKAVTESEILPKRGESLSLWRVPTLEEANEMRRRSKKGERARQREREAWLASDKYKAIAKHCKAALVTARKPGNPREALAWLHTIAEHIQANLEEYKAHKPPVPVAGDDAETYVAARGPRVQWLADMRRLRWFVSAVEAYGSGKPGKSLGQLLGLERGPGRPEGRKPGKSLDLARKISVQRETKSETRKTRQGEPARVSWKEIGRDNRIPASANQPPTEPPVPPSIWVSWPTTKLGQASLSGSPSSRVVSMRRDLRCSPIRRRSSRKAVRHDPHRQPSDGAHRFQAISGRFKPG
jgi:hypothetical protein